MKQLEGEQESTSRLYLEKESRREYNKEECRREYQMCDPLEPLNRPLDFGIRSVGHIVWQTCCQKLKPCWLPDISMQSFCPVSAGSQDDSVATGAARLAAAHMQLPPTKRTVAHSGFCTGFG